MADGMAARFAREIASSELILRLDGGGAKLGNHISSTKRETMTDGNSRYD
ncbi:MAG TPA: hypothetical protein VGD99_03575 [Anaerolineae bacterium]|jgi:hypothetical protein